MMDPQDRGAPIVGHAGAVPGALSTVWTLAGITLKRLGRGKAVWIALLFAALPVVYATIVHSRQMRDSARDLFNVSTLLLAIVPAMFVSSSIGEEIEERTSTYLWSRPIARWAVLAGKLCALTPIVIALVVGGWYVGLRVEQAQAGAPLLTSCLALAAGGVAASLISAGIATVLPKHGMSLTIGYMLVDVFIGALPFSLRELSITHQTGVLAHIGGDPPATASALITMAVVSGIWGIVAFVRIRRLET
jgi:hypothetical protein